MKQYICIDIGGTSIKYGVIQEDGVFLTTGEMPTEAQQYGGPGIMEKAKRIIETYKTEYHPEGICISTAGMVDCEKGKITYASPLIPDYTGTEIKAELEKCYGIPCEVENDVNCAGLAEYSSGAAKGCKVVLMLTIGTGIGGCIVLDGKVFHGFSNSACEVGYMHMDDSDFQTLGAASILSKKVSQWKGDSEEKWDGYHIFEEAKKGDMICNRAIDQMIEILGKGIANICYVINPEVVVLGGGIMAQEEFLRGKIQDAVKKYLISSIEEHTKIVFAKHQNDAGILGAFYHFCGVNKKL